MITIIHGFAGTAKTTKLKTFETDNSLWISDFKELCKKIDFKARGINIFNKDVKEKFFNMRLSHKMFKENLETFLHQNKIELVLFDNMELFPAGFARMILSVAKNSVCVFDNGFNIDSIVLHKFFEEELIFDEIIELNKIYIPKNIMELGLEILQLDGIELEYTEEKGEIKQKTTDEPNPSINLNKRYKNIYIDLEYLFDTMIENKDLELKKFQQMLYKTITRANKKIDINYKTSYSQMYKKLLAEYSFIDEVLSKYIEIKPPTQIEILNAEDTELLAEAVNWSDNHAYFDGEIPEDFGQI